GDTASRRIGARNSARLPPAARGCGRRGRGVAIQRGGWSGSYRSRIGRHRRAARAPCSWAASPLAPSLQLPEYEPVKRKVQKLHAKCRQHDERGHRSEEHTSELQSRENLVCRLLLEK